MSDTARLLLRLRQSITAVLRQVECDELDPAALLRAANAMRDAYHLALAATLKLAYGEAGVTVGNEGFRARVYEVERPFGVGENGK